MADELIDPDTMARLSAMMRRAPAGQPSIPGMEPAPPFVMPEVSSMIGPDIYNREFPDYIGNPPPTELPAIYNERFPPYIEERPALGFSPGPGESRWDAYGVRSAFPGNSYPPAPLPVVEPGIRAELRDYREPTTAFQPTMPLPDSGRAARVEQLMRDLEEQRALEARLRALGR